MRSEIHDGDFVGQAIQKLIREGKRKRWPIWHSVIDIVLMISWYLAILAAFIWLIVILT
jgi:preprotein translocase subunit SecE